MIDASKSPAPPWRRYATFALLAVLILAAGYVVWSKELHHSSTAGPASATAASPATTVPSSATHQVQVTVPTGIPGGIPISTRNPFSP